MTQSCHSLCLPVSACHTWPLSIALCIGQWISTRKAFPTIQNGFHSFSNDCLCPNIRFETVHVALVAERQWSKVTISFKWHLCHIQCALLDKTQAQNYHLPERMLSKISMYSILLDVTHKMQMRVGMPINTQKLPSIHKQQVCIQFSYTRSYLVKVWSGISLPVTYWRTSLIQSVTIKTESKW